MKAKRMKANINPFARGQQLRIPEYGAGQAAEILGVKVWQLRNLLDGPAYKLGLFDQIGEGKGSRRTFSREGLYRIATALLLLSDGFRPAFVGRVLESLDEAELSRVLDSEGREVSPVVVLRRTSKGEPDIKVESFRPDEARKIKDVGSAALYYALDLGWIVAEVDKKISDRAKAAESKKDA
jgi:hypothetical protein